MACYLPYSHPTYVVYQKQRESYIILKNQVIYLKYKVIDVHTHIWPGKLAPNAVEHVGTYYNYEMHGKGTIEDLASSASEAGVEKFVIHSSALKASQVETVNDATASHITDNIAGFGTLHPEYSAFEKEIKRIKSLGLKGIKLHPDFQFFNIDDRRMYPAYDIIRAEGLPILFHMGDEKYDYSSAIRLLKVLKDFPGIIVIGAHLGGHLRWDEAEELLVGKDIYMDCSSTDRKLSPERIRRIIRNHGCDRILFGTDYPIERHKEGIDKFLALGLTEEENKKILYDNAYNLIYK